MPIDIKRSTSPDTSIAQQGSVASGPADPHLSMSPIAQRMAMEVQDTAPPLNFNRGSPRTMSAGMRNASAPNFDTIKRQLSFESRGGNRPRFTSESQADTPTKMEIVSRSVRHSPNRRPFSAQFDDSFRHDSYAPKAMSGVSGVSSGTRTTSQSQITSHHHFRYHHLTTLTPAFTNSHISIHHSTPSATHQATFCCFTVRITNHPQVLVPRPTSSLASLHRAGPLPSPSPRSS